MKVYSFLNVVVLVNTVQLSDHPEGEDIVVAERFEESAFRNVGVDGKMTVSMNTDRSGTIIVKLKQNSLSNGFLTGLIVAQENGIFAPLFVQVINTEGGEVASGTQGYLEKPSALKFGQNLGETEWTFIVERLDILNAGQSEAA